MSNQDPLLANSMPASSGTNTRDFMCFFLFWLISLPAIWFPIHKMCASPELPCYINTSAETILYSRHLFTVKAAVVPVAGLTFFIWCIVKAHGVGPIIHEPSTIHGSALGWNMVASLMSCISNMATLVTYVFCISHCVQSSHALHTRNAPDFASRATYPSAAVLPQLISVPLGFSIVSFIGIIVSSSSQKLYGEAIWSPIDLLGKFLDNHPSHATRFGVCNII